MRVLNTPVLLVRCRRFGGSSFKVAEFLVSQGRMKFVRPLYRCLLEAGKAGLPGAHELAVGTFAANREGYHPICRKMVASDLDRALKATNQPPKTVDKASPTSPLMVAAFAAGVGFGAVIAFALAKARR